LAGASAVSLAVDLGLRRLMPGETGALASALVAGLVLLATFTFGIRRIPGCLEPGDLEVARFARDRWRAIRASSSAPR
jgi:hypothetical protein